MDTIEIDTTEENIRKAVEIVLAGFSEGSRQIALDCADGALEEAVFKAVVNEGFIMAINHAIKVDQNKSRNT